MSAAHPNHVRIHRGEHGSHGNFGDSCHVDPIHITRGAGHTPHLAAHFEGGVELNLTPAALINFIREGEIALSKLPRCYLHVADHVGGDE